MGDDTGERLCPDCGADMSLNGDGEWECDGPDCTAHLDAMGFDEDEDDGEPESDPDYINNDPRPREDRDVPWSDMTGR